MTKTVKKYSLAALILVVLASVFGGFLSMPASLRVTREIAGGKEERRVFGTQTATQEISGIGSELTGIGVRLGRKPTGGQGGLKLTLFERTKQGSWKPVKSDSLAYDDIVENNTNIFSMGETSVKKGRKYRFVLSAAGLTKNNPLVVFSPDISAADKPYPDSRARIGKTLIPGSLDFSTYAMVGNSEIIGRFLYGSSRFTSTGNPYLFLAASIVLLAVISLLLAGLVSEMED